ncbi:MAG: hydrogenase iron-sulfur subunit [Halobacteriota archaeon]|nr:hydrogenase iron-sulfur subunit [Halobacteriota archaeon]
MSDFEPKVVGFMCNWCCYAGADLAGVSRFQYPPSIRVIRVMCSGRVDPSTIIGAFVQGADGVFVGGCHPGDCHYISGNYYTEKKMKATKKLLEVAGMEPERLRLEWVSAGEGKRFSQVIKDFTEELEALGESPVTKGDEKMKARLIAVQNESLDFRLRFLIGKEVELVGKKNVYGETILQEDFDRLMDDIIKSEYIRNLILYNIEEDPLSAKEVSERIDVDSIEVVRHLVQMKRKQQVSTIEDDEALKYVKAVQ